MDEPEFYKFWKLSLSLWNALSFTLSSYKLLALTLLERMLSHWWELNARPDSIPTDRSDLS